MIATVTVDDHPVVRAGMRTVLDAVADALHLVAQHRPDVLVLDVNLPDLNGWEVIQQLRKQGTTTAILVLTAHDDS